MVYLRDHSLSLYYFQFILSIVYFPVFHLGSSCTPMIILFSDLSEKINTNNRNAIINKHLHKVWS